MSFLKLGSSTALAQEGTNESSNFDIGQAQKTRGPNNVLVAQESDISPQSDGSGTEVVPIAAFRNDGDSGNGWFNLFSGGYIENQSSGFICFMAPIYPPDGATLTQFRFTFRDDNAANDLYVFLDRVNLTTGSIETPAGGAVSGYDNPTPTEAFSTVVDPDLAIVSNAYAYYVDTCMPGGVSSEIRLYGARLFYTP
jgi:hypothetical protein